MMSEGFYLECSLKQSSSEEGMYQLFSDRLSQKMTNLSNVSDVQRSSTANGTDMFVKGQTALQCHSKTLHILCILTPRFQVYKEFTSIFTFCNIKLSLFTHFITISSRPIFLHFLKYLPTSDSIG